MGSELSMQSQEYKDWLTALKVRVRQIQLKAAVAVNQELLKFYWELGADIVERQKNATWGDGFLKQLSKDLRIEFPKWYLFYSDVGLVGQQPVGQLTKQPASQITKIPWGHNLAIISKCKSLNEALYYVQNTLFHGWSRSVTWL